MNIIKVTGASDLDIDLRTEALQQINKLPTDILSRLGELATNEKAKAFLSTDNGFKTVKAFLGA